MSNMLYFLVCGCVILFYFIYFHQLPNLKESIYKMLLLLIFVGLWLPNPSSVTMFDRNTMQKIEPNYILSIYFSRWTIICTFTIHHKRTQQNDLTLPTDWNWQITTELHQLSLKATNITAELTNQFTWTVGN